MKQTKRSPGPWKVEQHEGQLEVWSDNHFIATVEHKLFVSATKAGAKEANAALISAAPDLLSALELILNDDRRMNALTSEQAKAVMYSVAKAKGQ